MRLHAVPAGATSGFMCMRARTCVYVSTCVCMYVDLSVCLSVCMYVFMYICMYVCVSLFLYVVPLHKGPTRPATYFWCIISSSFIVSFSFSLLLAHLPAPFSHCDPARCWILFPSEAAAFAWWRNRRHEQSPVCIFLYFSLSLFLHFLRFRCMLAPFWMYFRAWSEIARRREWCRFDENDGPDFPFFFVSLCFSTFFFFYYCAFSIALACKRARIWHFLAAISAGNSRRSTSLRACFLSFFLFVLFFRHFTSGSISYFTSDFTVYRIAFCTFWNSVSLARRVIEGKKEIAGKRVREERPS